MAIQSTHAPKKLAYKRAPVTEKGDLNTYTTGLTGDSLGNSRRNSVEHNIIHCPPNRPGS